MRPFSKICQPCIFTEASPEHLFAYIDCLACGHEGPGPGAFCDPFSQTIGFLKNELLESKAMLEQLEREKAESLRLLQIAAATNRDICANLEKAAKSIPVWREFGQAKQLNADFVWLADKFRLSRSFPLFAENRLPDGIEKSGDFKEDIQIRYFTHLGLASISPIMEKTSEYAALRDRLPEDLRAFFPSASGFRAYFEKTARCLDALGAIPKNVLRKVLEDTAKDGFNSLVAKSMSTFFECLLPRQLDDGSWTFLDLLNDCNSIGDDLAREIIGSNKRLRLILALAIFPDPEYHKMAAEYRPGGVGDPEAQNGALNYQEYKDLALEIP